MQLIIINLIKSIFFLLNNYHKDDLDAVRFVRSRVVPFPFYLADLATDEGGVRGRAGRVSAQVAVKLSNQLMTTSQYKLLSQILPSKWLSLYFEKSVESQIFPVIRSMCTLEWLVDHGQLTCRREIIWHGHRGLASALREVWPSTTISLIPGEELEVGPKLRSIGRSVRDRIRYLIMKSKGIFRQAPELVEKPSFDSGTVAVHYVEGIDMGQRSDLFWFPDSDIDPSRILVYFDGINQYGGRLETEMHEQIVRQLDELGMKWIKRNDVKSGIVGWSPKNRSGRLLETWKASIDDYVSTDKSEIWVSKEALLLLKEVDYWIDFYDEFKVSIHVELNEGMVMSVAQSIAADLYGVARVGRERSDSWGLDTLGHHPDHVYFAWNRRGAMCAYDNRNQIDSSVICGFIHDRAWRTDEQTNIIKDRLLSHGAEFVVAFFDNAFWWGGGLSRDIVLSLYTEFLQWVIDDHTLGVVTKSKKPIVLDGLSEIEPLMEQAVATGRWVNLGDITGRLPSDASRAADISVGIGISSAVTEAVAGGCRGVHCDLRTMRSHPFYTWGFERVIFDNLDRMMLAFKQHKSDPVKFSELGDFSLHMDDIDPYNDGRSGERAGIYLKWMLESLDQGNSRNIAMTEATEKFRNIWGSDKIINGNLDSERLISVIE